mmetsp:Transcript_5819/g.14554  ORF Transcript_5819/g.14554 Transcript_5819/m.14554 type:complete len:299 (-) Transcript_5819:304-1200(-)
MTITSKDTMQVVAPATLNEGYTFDVDTVDGRTLAVTVPSGGVKEGQTFDAIVADPPLNPPVESPAIVAVPVDDSQKMISTTSKTIVNNPDGSQTVTEETSFPDGRVTKTVTTVAASFVEDASSPPPPAVITGAWRHDIFSCFDVFCNGMFWMSWCCTYIAMGQLLQRLKLNVCGVPGGDSKKTCMIWTILWCAMCCVLALTWVIRSSNIVVFLYYDMAVTMAILSLFSLTKARYYMRTKWSIPSDCCEGSGCLSDCCCVYWCCCCSIIQMMRHTHDEKADKYSCSSPTGLDAGAAEVV